MTGQVAEFLAKAAAEDAGLRIRDLLAIWGYRARTYDSVGRIRRDLSVAGLQCSPDLGDGGLDTEVRIGVPRTSDENVPRDTGFTGDENAAPATAAAEDQPLRLPHVFPLIGEIPSAVGGITTVHPAKTLQYAQGLMVASDYSQLAVMSGPRELIGAVSWRTIAAARLSSPAISLSDATDRDPKVVRTSDKLLEQINTIYAADFVFVRDSDDLICGIVTTADLSMRFRDLTTPFFQLGEIEYRLRRCTKPKFTVEELRHAAHNNRIQSVEDMSFGNYVYLLKDVAMWQKMGWEIDQDMFLEHLSKARDIRNKVAHYDATPVSSQEIHQLRQCLNFMRNLDRAPWI